MKKIAALSNKGGTGKSTLCVSLARALRRRGKTVSLLDLDFASPCDQLLTKTQTGVEVSREGLAPAYTEEGIELFSIGLIIKDDTPVMLRGAKRAEIVEQLSQDILWNRPDYLICDLPSGIQEECLSLLKHLKPDKTLIVMQPDKLSIASARRMIQALRQLKVNVGGIVENMSLFQCPACGKETRLFKDSAKDLAKEARVKFLGSIPFIPNAEALPIDEIVDKVM